LFVSISLLSFFLSFFFSFTPDVNFGLPLLH
jgi:hypothetical protein